VGGKYSHILWDWNGTLLDDTEWCMACINAMLARRGMRVLSNIEEYRSVFTFPVEDYYRRVGFDFAAEPFAALAEEYIALYHGDMSRLRLFPGVHATLRALRERGLRQSILSASRIDNLRRQIGLFNVAPYFDRILGISDIYARGKEEIAARYLREAGILGAAALVIGDTRHDAHVAAALGADCILMLSGHQNASAFAGLNVRLAETLADVPALIMRPASQN
jgi:phosphoglycolate phosphatase